LTLRIVHIAIVVIIVVIFTVRIQSRAIRPPSMEIHGAEGSSR